MPVTNVPTPGSPIRSNWAQSVSTIANANEAAIPTKVAKAGDVLSGTLTFGAVPESATPTAGVNVAPNGAIASVVPATTPTTGPNVTIGRGGSPAAGTGAIYVRFDRAGSAIGTITIASATSVAYNTTSDRRLKERTGDVDDALEIVAALGALAYRGRWIADEGEGKEWVFVNSQDVEPVAPFAVFGDPDGTDEDQIIPQQLDHGALVPLLLAAVSQLAARVADLEAR